MLKKLKKDNLVVDINYQVLSIIPFTALNNSFLDTLVFISNGLLKLDSSNVTDGVE